jgi:hypothetical protein
MLARTDTELPDVGSQLLVDESALAGVPTTEPTANVASTELSEPRAEDSVGALIVPASGDPLDVTVVSSWVRDESVDTALVVELAWLPAVVVGGNVDCRTGGAVSTARDVAT